MLGLLALALIAEQGSGAPLYGYEAGEQKFNGTLAVGALEQKTGIKGDGNTIYVVQIDGTGNTAGGRMVDGLYTFVDPHWTFGLPVKNLRVQLLEGTNPSYRDWEFYSPSGGNAYPGFQQNNSYRFLWRPKPNVEYAVVAPALKWTSPADDPLAGNFFVKISLAVPAGTAAKPKLTAVDCYEFRDNPGDIPIQPSLSEPKPYWINRMAREGKPLNGVAADGAAMIILRCETERPGKARFTLSGRGGMYPLASDVFRNPGVDALTVSLRPLDNGRFVALALYKPALTLAAEKESALRFSVQFSNEDGSSREKSDLELKLVRPPVVLVHGTYDNPKFCYDGQDAEDDSKVTMAQMLRSAGFRVSLLDWEATNGMKDPSSFRHNQHTVLKNPGGIESALYEMRRDGYAVMQADVICHSQGGVITRVYARGFPLTTEMTSSHPHFINPEACAKMECWYHRPNNYAQGDIHRLITISTTHRGSDVCRMFNAFELYFKNAVETGGFTDLIRAMFLGWFLVYVDTQVSGIMTQGYKNQSPGSPQLMAIGPTPIPAHAIACVATDEDMKGVRIDAGGFTKGMGNYYGKLYKIWRGTPDAAKQFALKEISSDKNPIEKERDYEKYRHEMELYGEELSDSGRQYRQDRIINLIRKIVFNNEENDCTVAESSSYGGLKIPYTSKMQNVLHGWAPRYRNVQAKVMELLTNDGSLFSRIGFPDSYAAERSTPGVWVLSASDAAKEAAQGKPEEPRQPGVTNPTPGTLNLGTMDPNAWSKSGIGGSAEVSNDMLALSAPSDGAARSFAKAPLKGDFDVTVEYRLTEWKPSETSAPALDIYLSAKPEIGAGTIQITRADFEDGGAYIFVEPGEVQRQTSGTNGRLRIQRSGAQWKVLLWTGGAWETLATISGTAGDIYIGFGVNTNGKDPAKASVRPRHSGSGND
jgi:hypothetical protein